MEEHKRVLKSIEAQYHKSGSRHTRDLQSFRTMLTELQDKVNEMEDTKAQHYMDVLQNEEHTWDLVAQNVLLLVRAQVDMADRLSSKAVQDPVLESLMAHMPDPFQSYGPPKRENELFSILQPTHASPTAPSPGLPRSDTSLFPEPDAAPEERTLASRPSIHHLFGYAAPT